MIGNSRITLHENFNELPQLLTDYLSGSERVSEFVHFFNKESDWKNLIASKEFSIQKRETLVHHLNNQYSKFSLSEEVKSNLNLLALDSTFTVTTGHQLCLLTGPLFFIYKIATTIKLAQNLKLQFPDKNFVPVYWLASEDHDFAEINHTYLFNKKISWNNDTKGAVGELSTETLNEFLKTINDVLGTSETAGKLKDIIKESYNHQTLADATIALVNKLFGSYGLVCLDANHVDLKKLFIPVIEKELTENFSHKAITETNVQLTLQNYQPTVESKEINLFYIDSGLRERIEFNGTHYIVRNSNLSFTKDQILAMVKSNPDKFSPNVILRPVYQETILPNLAYVGGPSEISYWMQFKKVFKAVNMQLPVLIYRDSFYLIDKQMWGSWLEMGFGIEDLKREEKELSEIFLARQQFKSEDFRLEVNEIKELLNHLKQKVELSDKSLLAALNAEEQKLLNGLSGIENKLNKTLKAKFDKQLNQIKRIKEKFFPNNIPQERLENVFQYLLKYDSTFIDLVLENIDLEKSNSKLLVLE